MDIDNVLADTTVHFIRKMYHRFGAYNGMTIKEMVLRFRYIRNVPTWQHKSAVLYLNKLVHSKKLYLDLITITNANKTVQKINKFIPIVSYITTRPNNLLQITAEWLKKHNFPNAPIISRPDDLH